MLRWLLRCDMRSTVRLPSGRVNTFLMTIFQMRLESSFGRMDGWPSKSPAVLLCPDRRRGLGGLGWDGRESVSFECAGLPLSPRTCARAGVTPAATGVALQNRRYSSNLGFLFMDGWPAAASHQRDRFRSLYKLP
jgi:hypothetical protein